MLSIALAFSAALTAGILTLVDPKLGIGFIAVVALVYLAFQCPDKVFIFFILSYPLLSHLPKVTLGTLPSITVERAIIVLLTVVVFLKRDIWPGPKINRFAILLIAIFLLSVLYASIRSMPVYQKFSFQILIDSYALAFMVFYVATRLFYQKINAEKNLWIFLMVGAYVAIMGIVEFIFRYDLLPSEIGLRETDLYVRANGPFATSETFGLFLGTCLFTAIYLKRVQQGKWNVKEISTMLIIVGGIVCSMNRGITISALCAFAFPYIATVRRQIKLITGTVFLFLCILLLFPYISESEFYRERIANFENIATRLSANRSAYAMIKDYPIAGIGLNNFAEYTRRNEYNLYYEGYSRPTTIHNAFLDVTAEMGFFGLVTFCGLMTAVVVCLIECRKHQVDGRLTAFSVFIMFLLPFFNDNLTKDSAGNYLFAIFVGATVSFLMKKKKLDQKEQT
jgi:hypothetical protein